MRRVRLLGLAVILAGLVPLFTAAPAVAVDATVNTTCDETEFDAALATVQGTGGGTLMIDCPSSTVFNFTAEKQIATAVTIVNIGNPSSGATFDAGGTSRHFVVQPAASLALEDVILRNGNALEGGSIFVTSTGSLTLQGNGFSMRIFNSVATDQGGAIYNDGGSVTITGGEYFSNQATNQGGGIYNDGGTLVLDGARLSGNMASSGGGIYNDGGQVTLGEFTSVDFNVVSGSGGGIENVNGGSASIYRAGVRHNEATGNGGGIQNEATLTIDNSYIWSNTSISDSGGGINNALGGSVEVTRTAFLSNSAATRGGGLRNGGNGSTAIVDTSTFYDNVAISNQGGGILNQGDLTLLNTTLAANESGTGGGGLRNTGTVMSGNTLYADNVGGGDCSGNGAFTSLDFNMDTDGTCPYGMANDITGVADLVPVNVFAVIVVGIGPGSDAVDAGPATCASPDHRGESRPRNGACDIGAIEIVPPPDVCVSLYTGALAMPVGGACNGQGQFGVIFEEGPHYLCANIYTGQITYSFSATCAQMGAIQYEMPDDAPVPVCYNFYTGKYRLLLPGRTCSMGEYATELS